MPRGMESVMSVPQFFVSGMKGAERGAAGSLDLVERLRIADEVYFIISRRGVFPDMLYGADNFSRGRCSPKRRVLIAELTVIGGGTKVGGHEGTGSGSTFS